MWKQQILLILSLVLFSNDKLGNPLTMNEKIEIENSVKVCTED